MGLWELDTDTPPESAALKGSTPSTERGPGPRLVTPPTEITGLPSIVVMGVGGGGGNAINNMLGSDLEGVTLVAANTDAQALAQVRCERKVRLGTGRGAGARPHIATTAAEAAADDIEAALHGADMLFIAAGLGGGTGTGAAPTIARLARQKGILTIGVVTLPFYFEGMPRMKIAEEGIKDLLPYTDTLIAIPNQRLIQIADTSLSLKGAFGLVDDVLLHSVQTISDLVVKPGLINLDFADVATVLRNKGTARIGSGVAEGPGRALRAASAALLSKLMGETPIAGARGLLVNVCGGPDLSILEVDQAVDLLRQRAHPEANIIFGAQVNESLGDQVCVSVVATGLELDIDSRPTQANTAPHTISPLDPVLADQPDRFVLNQPANSGAAAFEKRTATSGPSETGQERTHYRPRLEPIDETKPRSHVWRRILITTIAFAGVCGATAIAAWNLLPL